VWARLLLGFPYLCGSFEVDEVTAVIVEDQHDILTGTGR
jgi:hypothetical protein